MKRQGIIVKDCLYCGERKDHEIIHYDKESVLQYTPFVNIEEKDQYVILQCVVCYRKTTNDPALIYKHKDKRRLSCEKCGKVCIGYLKLRDHFCTDNVFIMEDYLKKARNEYQKTGKISHKKACVLLNCKPAQDLLINAITHLNLSNIIKDSALSFLKKIEKEVGIGQRLSPPKIGASCLYITCLLHNKHHSQKEIASLFKITASTLREGIKKIRWTKTYQEIEKELANHHYNYNFNLTDIKGSG